MSRNYYSPGSWNIICDSCSKKIKASESKQRWDGLIVCPSCYEQRHPQDFVKARQDKITVPFSRPRPPDVFNLTQGVFENVPVIDNIVLHYEYQKSYTDTISINDVIYITKSYTILDALTLTDTVLITDTGSMTIPVYAIDYFAEDYTQTSQTFT